EGVGLLAKIANPWNPGSEVAMFSGLHYTGTAASVLALTAFSERVLRDYTPGREFYRSVHGFDRDGDGRTDPVEVVEYSRQGDRRLRDLLSQALVRPLDAGDAASDWI